MKVFLLLIVAVVLALVAGAPADSEGDSKSQGGPSIPFVDQSKCKGWFFM